METMALWARGLRLVLVDAAPVSVLWSSGRLVTAAHCTLNGDQRTTRIKVYIGYSASSEGVGAWSDNQGFVTSIALPGAWGDTKAEQSDIAFLRLDKPFSGVTAIKYDTLETAAQQQLTVVGFPADLGARAGSPGGEMYYVQICREIDLERTSIVGT